MDNQNHQRRQQERTVAVGGVESGNLLIYHRLHLHFGFHSREAVGGVALQLDGVHLVDKYGVGTQQGGFVVVERAHVGKDRHMGCPFGCQVGGEIPWEVEDGMHVAVFHQPFGFGHGGAFVFHGDFRRGLHLVDKPAALVAVGLVDYGYRQVGDILIPIHEAEDDRVE